MTCGSQKRKSCSWQSCWLPNALTIFFFHLYRSSTAPRFVATGSSKQRTWAWHPACSAWKWGKCSLGWKLGESASLNPSYQRQASLTCPYIWQWRSLSISKSRVFIRGCLSFFLSAAERPSTQKGWRSVVVGVLQRALPGTVSTVNLGDLAIMRSIMRTEGALCP